MKYFISICILFLLASSALPAADPADEQLLTIKGTVVDQQDQPVPDAKVFVDHFRLGRDRIETRTDNQGKFALTATAARFSGQVLVVKADSLTAQHLLPWQSIAADPALQKLKLQVQPSKLVELEVVDQNEKPIAAAHAGIMDHNHAWGIGTTDEQGKIAFQVPHDVEIKFVGAFNDGHGADYRAFTLERGQYGDQLTKPPALPEHPVRLKLDGATPLKVKVQTSDGKPLAGIKVYPWYLTKSGEPREFNLSSLFYESKLLEQTTDEAGTTVFKWIPHWQQEQFVVWPRTEDYTHERGTYNPKTGKGVLTIELEQLVPISGQVRLSNGSPARGIQVTAVGDGYQTDFSPETVTTDDDGRYTIKVSPHMAYLVVAGNQTLASAPQTDFTVLPHQPVTGLDFQLRPATRLHGRVTLGPQQKPVAGQQISIFERGRGSVKLKEDQRPYPRARTFTARPSIMHRLTTDQNGEYELFVGAGDFLVRGPSQTKDQTIKIGEERQKEVNFHTARPEKGFLTGTVVTGDPPQPVSEAQITGIYRSQRAGFGMQTTTDAAGKFKVERELYNTVLCARSKDQKLAGIVEIGPDEETVTIPLQPVGSVRGQLIDEENDQPLKNQKLQYGVEIRMGKEFITYRNGFGGTLDTDENGKFELNKLVVGQEYKVSILIHPQDQPNSTLYRRVKLLTLKDSRLLDLGKLKVIPRHIPYKPPTIEERIAAAFKLKKTPLERFTYDKKIGSLTKQYPLVLFGDAKSKAIKQLLTLRYEDNDIGSKLDSFLVIPVDTSDKQRAAARDLARSMGVKLNADSAGFDLYITDTSGKQRAHADFAALSADEKVSKEKLLKFLKANQVPTLDARELLDTALQQAKQQNKRVIVQATATWCGPCRRLSLYLDRERKLWERDYIWIKMDYRWTGAYKIMEKMRNGAQGGIPWWAILDADGKILVTSNNDKDEDQNIGFPSSDSGRDHFRSMLTKTAIRLSSMEINQLVEALKQKEN
ncbi:Nickel uptake substrate-specific transmembrane region [Gimesia panareensis]|uniref:Nickel uptake substrate-specific transmembrane region n=1 Tax=Gimesia panareensis TaxID=2527978 RepID=A0A518FGM5_9PLAN|nr:carboxypeptidase regulatory-like domain-containing protein [Gimesia panareensis]QDV15498.1 Nickel uptake substrate-specific transmembrane region [Gimesia panareensis]